MSSGELNTRLAKALERRRKSGLLRAPRGRDPKSVDFSSNDYLGVSTTGQLSDVRSEANGATGSRLLTGHTASAVTVEAAACSAHDSAAALLFNSGYDANLSLFSCVPGHTDALVYDSLIHASVHDGMRASRAAARFPFLHNDLASLRHTLNRALEQVDGAVIVAVEAVYSMDGDVAPLAAIFATIDSVREQHQRDVQLIVDEAHSGGIYGANGSGLVSSLGFTKHPALLAWLITYGKAYGAHGAVVLCSDLLRSYLLNYARPLIYSTALPPNAHAVILASYSYMRSKSAVVARTRLWLLRDKFRTLAKTTLPPDALMSEGRDSAIQGVLVAGNQRCVAVSNFVRDAGYDVYPIRAPTVPKGKERLRVVIHAHNTIDEVEGLVTALKDALVTIKLHANL